MANEYTVNAADLTSVANAIRAKGGTSAQLVFPSGFVSAIDAIQIGTEVQTTSGSFKTNSSGTATATCNFKPDLVLLYVSDDKDYTTTEVGFAFTAAGETELNNMVPPPSFGTYIFSLCNLKQTSTGFSATITKSNSSFEFSNDTNRTISYTAIKYT